MYNFLFHFFDLLSHVMKTQLEVVTYGVFPD